MKLGIDITPGLEHSMHHLVALVCDHDVGPDDVYGLGYDCDEWRATEERQAIHKKCRRMFWAWTMGGKVLQETLPFYMHVSKYNN